jgi:hypothetical protein
MRIIDFSLFLWRGHMLKKVPLTDIQLSLTPDIVRTFQIIYIAIISGATIFFFMVIFMYMTGTPSKGVQNLDQETITNFSIIHAVLFISCLVISNYIYNQVLLEPKVESMLKNMRSIDASTIAGSYIGIIRTAKIIRVAIIEAPVFFGLVTCFMAVTNNIIQEHSYYWLNVLSYFIFVYLLAKDFPTKDKLLGIFKTQLKYLVEY